MSRTRKPAGITPTISIGLALDDDGAADDGRIAAEAALPVAVREHHPGLPAGLLIGLRQPSADDGRDAKRLERAVRRHGRRAPVQGRRCPVTVAAAAYQIPTCWNVRLCSAKVKNIDGDSRKSPDTSAIPGAPGASSRSATSRSGSG